MAPEKLLVVVLDVRFPLVLFYRRNNFTGETTRDLWFGSGTHPECRHLMPASFAPIFLEPTPSRKVDKEKKEEAAEPAPEKPEMWFVSGTCCFLERRSCLMNKWPQIGTFRRCIWVRPFPNGGGRAKSPTLCLSPTCELSAGTISCRLVTKRQKKNSSTRGRKYTTL